MTTIILDTSALVTTVTGNQNFTQDLLSLAQKKFVRLVASKETISELKAVLEYPKIKENIKPKLQHFLDYYWQNVQVIDVPTTTKSLTRGTTKDPKDDMYIALAQYSKADYLVSLDRKHLVSLGNWESTQIVLPPMAILGVAKSYGFEWTQQEALSIWWKEIEPKIMSQASTPPNPKPQPASEDTEPPSHDLFQD